MFENDYTIMDRYEVEIPRHPLKKFSTYIMALPCVAAIMLGKWIYLIIVAFGLLLVIKSHSEDYILYKKVGFKQYSEIKINEHNKLIEEQKKRANGTIKYYPTHAPTPQPTIQCPYCKSTNTRRIDGFERFGSVFMLGFGSGKLGKQWHCEDCKSNF